MTAWTGEARLLYGNPRYGYGVYKKNQVNVGNPFAVLPPAEKSPPQGASSPEPAEEAQTFIPIDLIEKARRDAAMIVREAELEAERMMVDARERILEEAEGIARQSRTEGYAEGERQARAQYEGIIAEAEDTLAAAHAEYSQTLSGLESDMVHLVLDIARKAIGTELSTQPDAILSVIRSTLADVTPTEHVIVKISPQDYDHVVENRDRLASTLGFLCELDIRRDASLSRGACVLDTGRGTVDGSVDSRFHQMEEAILALLGGMPETPVTGVDTEEGEG